MSYLIDRILDSFLVEEDALTDASALDSISAVPQITWDELKHTQSPDVLRNIANKIKLRYQHIPHEPIIPHEPTIPPPIISMPEDPPIWRVHVKVSVERYSYSSHFRSKNRKAVKRTLSFG